MPMPETIILDSEGAVKTFIRSAAKMRECEYDLNDVVEEVFRVIGGSDEVFTQDTQSPHDLLHGLQLDDAMKLSGAVATLTHALKEECVRLKMYDERGRLGYRPTGWLTEGTIVLTRNDIAEGI